MTCDICAGTCFVRLPIHTSVNGPSDVRQLGRVRKMRYRTFPCPACANEAGPFRMVRLTAATNIYKENLRRASDSEKQNMKERVVQNLGALLSEHFEYTVAPVQGASPPDLVELRGTCVIVHGLDRQRAARYCIEQGEQ